MRAHGVHVAPSALDRVVEKDAAAAARLEEPVHGPDAPVDCFAGVPFAAGTRRQRDFFASAGEAHHLGKITEHTVARSTDFCSSLCQSILDERILDDARLVTRVDAFARLFAERVESAKRRTNGGSGDAVCKNEPERQPIERRIIYCSAGVLQVKRIQVRMRAVFRHERIFDDDVLAARGAQAHHTPVVVDRIVVTRQ